MRALLGYDGGGVAGGQGVHVGEDEVAGAVAAACGLILAADDREGVEDVGGVLAGQAVEVEIEGVEAGAQVAALLRVPGERRAAAEKVSPAAIRRDTSSRTRRRRP